MGKDKGKGHTAERSAVIQDEMQAPQAFQQKQEPGDDSKTHETTCQEVFDEKRTAGSSAEMLVGGRFWGILRKKKQRKSSQTPFWGFVRLTKK